LLLQEFQSESANQKLLQPVEIKDYFNQKIFGVLTMRIPSKQNSLEFLRNQGLSVGTIIDIGVQDQTKELIQVFPDLKHILFEPVEEYYPLIAQSYKSIDYDLIKCAVSNENGTAVLNVTSQDNERGFITHSQIGSKENTPLARTVEKITLDSFFEKNNYPKPDLLKIDVDGHEIPILEGSVNSLNDCSCVVIEAPLAVLLQRMNFLTSRGFILWDIVDLAYYYDNLSQVDLIFLNKTEKNKANFNPWSNFEFKWDQWVNLNKLFES
jgi:FkbM family methyltransferase